MSMNAYATIATSSSGGGQTSEEIKSSEEFVTRVHHSSIVFAEEIWYADIAAWGYLALVVLVISFAALRIV